MMQVVVLIGSDLNVLSSCDVSKELFYFHSQGAKQRRVQWHGGE